jgi:uncharacterized membrane protein
MKKGVLFLFVVSLLSLLFLQIVSASSYTLELSQVGNRVIVNEDINLDAIKTITLELPADYSHLSVSSDYNLDSNNLTISGKSLKLSYITSKGIFNSAEGFYFAQRISYPENFDNAQIKLILDSGVVVKDKDIFPTNYRLESDGERIVIVWGKNNVTKNNENIIFVSLEDLSKGFNIYSLSGLIIFIILVAVIIIAYKKYSKKNEKNFEEHLIESEKKIIAELKKADRNTLWQKQLQTSSGFSKAKLSRVIRNLESRGLIKKVPYGNTNKISLK